jgi:aryl-alcohol dehydrogenase-like predicted oxidoreductase
MATLKRMNRRNFVKTTALAAAATAFMPTLASGCTSAPKPMKRMFGKLGFNVTTLGLGGQASLQWTPQDVDPVEIILKAFKLGINYFDTSNLYGPSQAYFGKAFKLLNLVPGGAIYDENLRKSIFLTTKTHLRYAKSNVEVPGVTNWTNGEPGTHTVDDLHRYLSQMFGDGKGNYPKGAYLDMVLIHNLNRREEVDALYEGLDNTDPNAERIGALAALRDYRDGTNRTGLNPANEILIRHIGFSGHFDPSVNMYMIQRDENNLLDAMLVAINANDKQMFNMQHNVIPLASAKNMGVIGMKVFADGAMYSKPAGWSENPGHVIRTVGDKIISSEKLIKYSLTTPGVHLVIIGIGQIGNNINDCQLLSNIAAAQILPDGLTKEERSSIEMMALKAKDGKTNYFQTNSIPLAAPAVVSATQEFEGTVRKVTVAWNTAYASDAPLKTYEIWRDGSRIDQIPFEPQLTTGPFNFMHTLEDKSSHEYTVKVVDEKGRIAESSKASLPKI